MIHAEIKTYFNRYRGRIFHRKIKDFEDKLFFHLCAQVRDRRRQACVRWMRQSGKLTAMGREQLS